MSRRRDSSALIFCSTKSFAPPTRRIRTNCTRRRPGGPDYRSVQTPYATQSFDFGRVSLPASALYAFLVALLMAGALLFFLHRTRDGRALRAMVQNRYAATLMGVNTDRLNRVAFSAGVTCAGVASCALTPIYYTFPTVGVGLIITAFVVVVLGGLGSIIGALIGGLSVVQTLTGFFISVELKPGFRSEAQRG
jgi:branched-chain amino acid transport system permease protein